MGGLAPILFFWQDLSVGKHPGSGGLAIICRRSLLGFGR